jgi:hypothetical protein
MRNSHTIFTKTDVLGDDSTVNVNVYNHVQNLQNPSLKDIAKATSKLRARGKTYWKLHMIQLTKGDW